MTDAEAEAAAQTVINRSAQENWNVLQTREFAATLGLEVTPSMTEGGATFRAFIYVTPEGTRRMLNTRIFDLPEGEPLKPPEAPPPEEPIMTLRVASLADIPPKLIRRVSTERDHIGVMSVSRIEFVDGTVGDYRTDETLELGPIYAESSDGVFMRAEMQGQGIILPASVRNLLRSMTAADIERAVYSEEWIVEGRRLWMQRCQTGEGARPKLTSEQIDSLRKAVANIEITPVVREKFWKAWALDSEAIENGRLYGEASKEIQDSEAALDKARRKLARLSVENGRLMSRVMLEVLMEVERATK